MHACCRLDICGRRQPAGHATQYAFAGLNMLLSFLKSVSCCKDSGRPFLSWVGQLCTKGIERRSMMSCQSKEDSGILRLAFPMKSSKNVPQEWEALPAMACADSCVLMQIHVMCFLLYEEPWEIVESLRKGN